MDATGVVMTDDERQALMHAIQTALEKERRIDPSLYEPSPGQIPSHVDHRVVRVVLTALEAYEADKADEAEERYARANELWFVARPVEQNLLQRLLVPTPVGSVVDGNMARTGAFKGNCVLAHGQRERVEEWPELLAYLQESLFPCDVSDGMFTVPDFRAKIATHNQES